MATRTVTVTCGTDNSYDGQIGVRISSIFVIFVGSFLGAWLPVYASRRANDITRSWVFKTVKFFGSGVILGTAFIHLLGPAYEALLNPCLTSVITKYSWPSGICLMAVFVIFLIEIMTSRSLNKIEGPIPHGFAHHAHDNRSENVAGQVELRHQSVEESAERVDSREVQQDVDGDKKSEADFHDVERGNDNDNDNELAPRSVADSYAAQLTSVFILEFGVIFHSVFVGLTLAVTGKAFRVLYPVLVFHQTFEGVGLGARLATVNWPKSKRWTPYYLAVAYAVSTPIAIAIGLAVRTHYDPGSQKALIISGVFNSISAGILIYTGLVELMAHDFIFNKDMQTGLKSVVYGAYFIMCFGAGIMAMLGYWV